MTHAVTEKKIKAIECRFAVHCPSKDSPDDIHLIKEVVHYEDGATEPRVVLRKNFKRPFYITKKGKQNFKDFKEWMDLADLDRFECTEDRLTDSIAKGLKTPWFRGSLKDLCKSPYVFGADITSTSILKQEYIDRFPETQTPYTVAVFDTETDMVHGTKEIIMASVTCKTHVFTVVKKSFVEKVADAHARTLALAEKYIGDILRARNAKINLRFVDAEVDIVHECMKFAHEIKPDLMAVWNIEFDLEKIEEACAKAHVSVADILSDPCVPKENRLYKFKKGASKKTMASGRMLNFKPAQRWHSVRTSSSFHWIDAMQVYRQVRTGAPEEQSYGLDAILKKNKLGGKLKFDAANHVEGGEWHTYMQKHYPLEYIVYNIYDCIGVEMLDEKTKDLQLSMPMFAGTTDFANFNSLPRKSMNELHWFCRDLGRVPGSTASEMADELDADTAGVSGWIVMLPSHLIEDNGLQLIIENPSLRTNIRIGVAD